MRAAVAAAALLLLGGCQTFSREYREPSPVGVLPSKEAPRTIREATGVEDEDSQATIMVDETSFMVRPMKPQDVDLPDFYVPNLSATESGIQDALQLMLEGTGLTLNVEGGPRAMERFGASQVQNVKGGLRKVLDTMSNQIGFFWSASNGVLTIEPDQLFVVELPPAVTDDSLASMANTLQFMGARDSYLDRLSRSFVFRANRKALKNIDDYLASVRATRSMLVYEIKVLQVDLTDGNTQGVSWNAATGNTLSRAKSFLDAASGTGSDLSKSFSLTSAGAGLGAVIMGPKFSLDALVEFLKTQGTVKTVSQPRLAMLNGAKGTLRVGETTTYVSKVGSDLAGSGVSQVTVETKDLRTGLELGLVGEEHDSTITTHVSLQLSELLRFNNYTALGTQLSLPDVTDRELRTVIRLPPGYTALLGGITVQRESDDRKAGIQTNHKATSVEHSEIVMVLKPLVVHFKKREAAPATPAAVQGPISTAAVAAVNTKPVFTPTEEQPVTVDVAAGVAVGLSTSQPAGKDSK